MKNTAGPAEQGSAETHSSQVETAVAPTVALNCPVPQLKVITMRQCSSCCSVVVV